MEICISMTSLNLTIAINAQKPILYMIRIVDIKRSGEVLLVINAQKPTYYNKGTCLHVKIKGKFSYKTDEVSNSVSNKAHPTNRLINAITFPTHERTAGQIPIELVNDHRQNPLTINNRRVKYFSL